MKFYSAKWPISCQILPGTRYCICTTHTVRSNTKRKSNQYPSAHLLEHFTRHEPATWELQGGVGDVSVGQELEQHSAGDTSREPDEAAGLPRAHHVALQRKFSNENSKELKKKSRVFRAARPFHFRYILFYSKKE